MFGGFLGCGSAHHIIEALFKAFARALSQASQITGEGILSSKGTL